MPVVRENVVLHKGMFNPVLGDFLKDTKEKIAFFHEDCDIYPSTVDVFNCVEKYLMPGTIIALMSCLIILIGSNMNLRPSRSL